jgi:hypothetical protein
VQGEVGLAVGGVGEPVQARPGPRIRHVRLDPQLVGFPQAGQRQPVPGQRSRIHLPAVEHGSAQPGRAELDETPGARGAAAEPDHGGGAERLAAAGHVEVDAVTADVEEPRALPRLLEGQRGHAVLPASRHGRTAANLPAPGAGWAGSAPAGLGSATNWRRVLPGLATGLECGFMSELPVECGETTKT